MTVFGKILVVFLLIASLVAGSQYVFHYMTGVNYLQAYKKQEINSQRDEAAAVYERGRNDSTFKENQTLKDQQTHLGTIADIKARDDELKSQREDNKKLRNDLLEEKKKTADYDAIVKSYLIALKQSTDDKNRLKQLLDKEMAANATLRVSEKQARQDKTAAEVNLNTLKELKKQQDERTQDLVKEIMTLKRERQTGGSAVTGTTLLSLSAPNPPPFAVDGKVTEVAGDDLVQISVGSDAGLERGHTLSVFRLGPRPQYLGMIRLIRVEPNRSVGQVVGKSPPLLAGDNVASKILGN